MKTEELKDLWKEGIEKEINYYSEQELSDKVMKSARKSMKKIQLSMASQLFLITIMLYQILKIFFCDKSIELIVVDFIGFLILFTCFLFRKRSSYKMNNYNYDKSIKEWLEYRIHEIKKTISWREKYNYLILGVGVFVGFSFYIAQQLLSQKELTSYGLVILFIGLFSGLLFGVHSLKKKNKKVLDELESLYKQFEEKELELMS